MTLQDFSSPQVGHILMAAAAAIIVGWLFCRYSDRRYFETRRSVARPRVTEFTDSEEYAMWSNRRLP